MPVTERTIPDDVARAASALEGLPCWYVSTGGAVGSTFKLAFGRKLPRAVPVNNLAHSEEFRRFDGEVSILVWCAWRLDDRDRPITSWDDVEDSVGRGLRSLIGASVESCKICPPAWDAEIVFSNGLCLRIFSDHVPGDPSFSVNWDFKTQSARLGFGPGATYTVKSRDDSTT
jgi:hypothetical protein